MMADDSQFKLKHSSWPEPDYDNPVTHGKTPVFLNLVFLALTIFVGSLRIYSRLIFSKSFGSDDILIIFAIFFTAAQGVEVYLATTKYQLDRHIWDVTPKQLAEQGRIAYLHNILFILAANTTHVSWLCFYYRLSTDTGIDWFRNILHTSVATIIVLFGIFLALAIRLCLPIKAMWAWPPIENANCLRRDYITFAGGTVKIVIDIILIAIPFPLISKLKLPKSLRIAVLCLFSLGGLVVCAGCFRSYYVWRMYFGTDDITWVAYWAYFWSALEHYLGIMCACVPLLQPLLGGIVKWYGKRFKGKPASFFRKSEKSTESIPKLQLSSSPSGLVTRPTAVFEKDSADQMIWELERR